jgi:hypothetical protein
VTNVQKIGLAIAILGFLAGASTQLTDIFAPFGSIAPVVVKEIVSISGFGSGILGIIVSNLTGQANQIKAVQDMPGVESIVVNANANKTLAQLAVDPAQAKVDVKSGAEASVNQTARGP